MSQISPRELHAAHIGKRATITTNGETVNGTLAGVEHIDEGIANQSILTEVTLRVLGHKIRINANKIESVDLLG